MPWKTFKGSLFRAILGTQKGTDKQKSLFPPIPGVIWGCLETTLLIGLTWHFQYVYFVLSSSSKCSMNNGTDSSTKFPLSFSRQWGESCPKAVFPAACGVGGLGQGSSALSLVPRRQGSRLQEGRALAWRRSSPKELYTAPLKNKDVEKPWECWATKAETGRTFRVSLKPRRASWWLKWQRIACSVGDPG